MRRPGAMAPPRNSPLLADDVEGGGGAHVDDDDGGGGGSGAAVELVGGDAVDDAVGADLGWGCR